MNLTIADNDASQALQFINEIKRILGPDLTKSGASFYSSIKTLKKGKFLVLGLNPGGDPETTNFTIADSLEKILDENYNEYFKDWSDKNRIHRLQKNLQLLFEFLGEDLQNVCATNIFYERTKRASGLSIANVELYKEILRKTIDLVQPGAVITFGQQTFTFLTDLFKQSEIKTDIIESGHAQWKIQLTSINTVDRKFRIVCIPHLSIYTLYTRPEKMQIIKDFLSAELTDM